MSRPPESTLAALRYAHAVLAVERVETYLKRGTKLAESDRVAYVTAWERASREIWRIRERAR